MSLVTRADGHRVFAFGIAGLVPAALLTLLLVHQPSIGGRRLYPMLRGSLAVAGLTLALATVLAWAASANRLNRTPLSGLAWAGVTVVLCIGPFLESRPRARLYALDLEDGDVIWAATRATAPTLVDGLLVVVDAGTGEVDCLEPATGEEQDCRPADGAATGPSSSDVGAAADGPEIVDGVVAGSDGATGWTVSLAGATVVDLALTGDDGYAYVSTPRADGGLGGAIVRFDRHDGRVLWHVGLPPSIAAIDGRAAIGAGGDTVVVAGGERVAALGADDGQVEWSHSVASLGKSRGYALRGSVQDVIVTDTVAYLSATPQA